MGVKNMEHKKTNSNAIISLIFGLLSLFVPFIGIVFSIIGMYFYTKAKKEILVTNEDGKSFATAGFICSIIGLIYGVLIILLAFLGFFAFFNNISY